MASAPLDPPAAATPRVQREWSLRVAAEYGSAAVTAQLAHWLLEVGASPELVDAALDVTRDELEHARLCRDVCAATGGDVTPTLPPQQLRLPTAPAEGQLADITRAAVRVFCINETHAVPLFTAMRKNCHVAVARRALDRIVADEVRHRDFGWLLLGWLMELDDPGLRTVATEEAKSALEHRANKSAAMRERDAEELKDNELAWGLLQGPRYTEIYERCRDQVLLPRFRELGVLR